VTGEPSSISADEVIQLLQLAPHPEGGHYRETFRDDETDGKRAASTAIYFLLKAGEHSHWHAVDAVEIWHHYAGDALLLEIAAQNGSVETICLGKELSRGERPQAAVPLGCWQRARSLGSWTLVGCTVAPGFSFDGFTLAPPDFDPSR